MVSVLLVAAGLFYTNDANRKQQQLGLDQQKLALQEQVSTRFTAAIDHLGQEGPDKLSVRLGGVYALQRLMVDSPPDEPVVIQVLCAFVRAHAPRPAVRPRKLPPSRADIRAAVAVIGGRPEPALYPVDLAGSLLGLDHMNLAGADLSGAFLRGAGLFHTDLTGAHLRGAKLADANLTDANLSDADLTGADLTRANLTGAKLTGADLTGTDLTGTDLTGTDLTGVTGLTGAQRVRAGRTLPARVVAPRR